jgi:hypothetical protein
MDFDKMSEEQILQRLLDADTLPERTVKMERLGIPLTLKGLTGKQVFKIREKCSTHKEVRGQVIDQLDEEQLNVTLVAAATVKPNWGDPKLLNKYSASSAEEVLKRLLLAGELAALSDAVMELSGFGFELEDVKN